MWVRLVAHTPIHVMNEELIAFRIRSNNQNMSAPRVDTMLRSLFEYAHILERFLSMPAHVLEETFAQDAAENGIASEASRDVWLALLALTVDSPPHRLFALKTLFETAQSDEDVRRFRNMAGATDVFGTLEISRREARISELGAALGHSESALAQADEVLAQARGALADSGKALVEANDALARTRADAEKARAHANARMAALDDALAAGRAQIGALERDRAQLTRSLQRLTGSRSWRYTAPFRTLLATMLRRG
jgi:hypothetical protein